MPYHLESIKPIIVLRIVLVGSMASTCKPPCATFLIPCSEWRTKEAPHGEVIFVAIAVPVGLGAGSVASLLPSAHADGLVVEGKEAMKGTGKSLTEATGKLKTDATQTKEDAKKLDIDKTKQGVGQVKEDVKGVKESAKGALTNPLGK